MWIFLAMNFDPLSHKMLFFFPLENRVHLWTGEFTTTNDNNNNNNEEKSFPSSGSLKSLLYSPLSVWVSLWKPTTTFTYLRRIK